MTREQIIERGKKIRELAIRGVDGERSAAKEMLEAYMLKHNLTDADLGGPQQSTRFRARSSSTYSQRDIDTVVLELLRKMKTGTNMEKAIALGLLVGIALADGISQNIRNNSKK